MGEKGYLRTIIILSATLLIVSFVAICLGRFSSNPVDVYQAILSRTGFIPTIDSTMETIVFTIRIPRVLAAVMTGAMLSLSGAAYQGVFKNPLVSPDILGVAAGATVGAAGAILLGLGMFERQFFAFLGGILAVVLATSIPRLLNNQTNLVLVLSGIIVGGFLSSICAIMKFVAEEQTELSTIVFWQMGSFGAVTMKDNLALGPAFLLGLILISGLSWRINILSFGEVEAQTLGMNIKRIRGIIIASASLLTASAVSVCGIIGWVGLVIPHLARLLVGSDHVKMIPVTALTGSIFMLVIDTIARTLLTVEIPLSILTGFIGAPVYAWLLYRQRMNIS